MGDVVTMWHHWQALTNWDSQSSVSWITLLYPEKDTFNFLCQVPKDGEQEWDADSENKVFFDMKCWVDDFCTSFYQNSDLRRW